jgi:uncharacterized membrane protein
MSTQIKQTLLGILIGLAGNIIGFLIYGQVLCLLKGIEFNYFIKNMFLETELFRSQIITGSLLVNIIIFYFFMKQKRDSLARGMMIVILLTVIAIVCYYQ